MDDPLLTVVAAALREHGVTDPKAVMAAAGAALRVLGRDRCICRRAMHAQHHNAPVDGCPYCAPGSMPGPRKRGTTTVQTGGLL